MTPYTVRPGDTLSAIAQHELGAAARWPEIANLNGLANPDLIYPGQQLRMPSSGIGRAIADWFKSRMR